MHKLLAMIAVMLIATATHAEPQHPKKIGTDSLGYVLCLIPSPTGCMIDDGNGLDPDNGYKSYKSWRDYVTQTTGITHAQITRIEYSSGVVAIYFTTPAQQENKRDESQWEKSPTFQPRNQGFKRH